MLTERQSNSVSMAEVRSTTPTQRYCIPLDEQRKSTRFQRDEGMDFAGIWREPQRHLRFFQEGNFSFMARLALVARMG